MTVYQPPEPPPWLSTPPQPVYQRAVWPPPEAVKRERGPGPHDTVLASALLGVHFVTAAVGVMIAVLLNYGLRAYYERIGVGYFESASVAHAQVYVVVAQIVVFVASVVLTFVLMRRKRRSFYVPLAATVLAAITFWLLLLPPTLADHTLGKLA